jgi:prevent-host-death family protein
MTRFDQDRRKSARDGYWPLQEAKARLSEVVRRVKAVGPQHVTLHGREEVVVLSADDYRRLTGAETGAALIEAMQAMPHKDVDLEPERVPMPVRDPVW